MFYCSTNYSENSVYADYTTRNPACQGLVFYLTPLIPLSFKGEEEDIKKRG
jgi:hypothetical protein